MTTRTTIEFMRTTGTDERTGDAITEAVNAEVLADGDSVQIDLPAPGRWACDQVELRAALESGWPGPPARPAVERFIAEGAGQGAAWPSRTCWPRCC